MAARKRKPTSTTPRASTRTGVASRNQRLLVWVVIFYVVVLAAMVASDHYTFILKSLIVPVLLLAALLSGRLKRFINDWVVFLAAVEFFDFGRGLAFALTSHFELPMHLRYVVDAERWLCRGAIAPIAVQQLRAGLSNPFWLDRFFVLVYSSHFVFFLIFGLVVWFVRPRAFRAYQVAILGALYGGLVGYFLVPTVPPWMASNEFGAIPPITQFVRTIYNVHLPHLLAAFDVNTIAAMPSVHAAVPAVCALFALRHFGRRGLPVLAYAALVWGAVIYLGEHYLTDVMAGILLAVAVDLAVWRWVPAATDETAEAASDYDQQWQTPSIAIALTMVAVAYGLGQLSARWIGPLPVTRSFVERDLLGRSPVAHYLLGRIAFAHQDYVNAETELAVSLGELTDPKQQPVIRAYLGESAYRNGHMPQAIEALEPLRATTEDSNSLLLLANAYVESGRYDDGVDVLREGRRRFPDAPEPMYWLARYQYTHGDLDAPQLEAAIAALGRLPSNKARSLRQSLLDLRRETQAVAH